MIQASGRINLTVLNSPKTPGESRLTALSAAALISSCFAGCSLSAPSYSEFASGSATGTGGLSVSVGGAVGTGGAAAGTGGSMLEVGGDMLAVAASRTPRAGWRCRVE